MGSKHKKKRVIKARRHERPAEVAVSTVQTEPMRRGRANRFWDVTTVKAVVIITAVGLAVFFSGLSSPFMDDDQTQIVNNPVVQSIGNIKLFFQGSTFYNGHGLAPLTGIYYRPLMTTTFSLLYTIFGAQPVAFHVFQMLLCIAASCLVFLFFRYTFSPAMALVLSLVFLVHPLDSQAAFAIPSMQEPLFLSFGMLALWLLLRFGSVRSLLAVAGCLFLSMLSKETGVLFVGMALLYLVWFDRKRLYPFIGVMALPLVCYLALKVNAVGLSGHTNIAPIDSLNLAGRLMTVPSIILFYITKLVFPYKLASAYYWTYPTFSISHTLIPFVVDGDVLAALVYGGRLVRRRLAHQYFLTYLFFGSWLALGLLPHLQLIPLDMTVCENWFYFPMIGFLGMLGLVGMASSWRPRPIHLLALSVVLVTVLGLRTALRGAEWGSLYSLASHNVEASKEDYVAYADLAEAAGVKGDFGKARAYELQSIEIYPSASSYSDLGLILGNLGEYSEALHAYAKSIDYARFATAYENAGTLLLVYGDPSKGKSFLEAAIQNFPHDAALWIELAVLEEKGNDSGDAKTAISTAASYGEVPNSVYDGIINDHPFKMDLAIVGKTITIQ